MGIFEKFLLLAAAACWVMFYFVKKNIAFGVAVGVTVFALVYILAYLS